MPMGALHAAGKHSNVGGDKMPRLQMSDAMEGTNPSEQNVVQAPPLPIVTPSPHSAPAAEMIPEGALQEDGKHVKLGGVKLPRPQLSNRGAGV
jgi:hypothetical protein